MIAASKGDYDAVSTLLKYFDVNAHGPGCETALMYSLGSHVPEVTQLLLDNGAKLEARDKNGNTALARAATHSYDGLMTAGQCLLDAGADINTRNDQGITPLMAATDTDCIQTARDMIDRGADIHATNNLGQTAADIARRKGRTDFADFLEITATTFAFQEAAEKGTPQKRQIRRKALKKKPLVP